MRRLTVRNVVWIAACRQRQDVIHFRRPWEPGAELDVEVAAAQRAGVVAVVEYLGAEPFDAAAVRLVTPEH